MPAARARGIARVPAAVLTAALGLVVLLAGPAAAEPARAGRDRAEVRSIEPASVEAAIDVSVAGGDASLVLDVVPGHEVTVLGYDREPYLRIQRDGTVLTNTTSRSAAVNGDRFGAVDAGPATTSADPTAAATWIVTGSGGRAVWHDHRVHWMAPSVDPTVGADGHIQDWGVDLVVDGQKAAVRGELRREADVPAWPYLGLALVVAGGLLVGSHRRPLVGLVLAGGVSAAALVVVEVVAWASRPPGATADLVLLGLTAATVASVATAASQLRRRPRVTWYAGLAGAAAAVGALTQLVPEWWRPVLVTAMPAVAERSLVAVVAGAVAASALLLLQAVEAALVTPAARPSVVVADGAGPAD